VLFSILGVFGMANATTHYNCNVLSPRKRAHSGLSPVKPQPNVQLPGLHSILMVYSTGVGGAKLGCGFGGASRIPHIHSLA